MRHQQSLRVRLHDPRSVIAARLIAGSKVICSILLLLSVPACLGGETKLPADEVRAAAADIESLPLELRPLTRYLSLYAVPPQRRREAVQVVNYTLNALSRTRAITQAVPISPTLLRFNIAQYASRKDELTAWIAAWEKLAESDPYFHLRTEIAVPHVTSDAAKNNHSPVHPLTPSPPHLQTVTTDGGWADLNAAAKLRAATGSIGALLRADYFVAQATIAPRYYEFSGVPETEDEFLKSLGLDREVIDRLRANAGANLIISGVTAKPRRVVWAQGPLGGVYSTLDVQQVDAERDPLRRPISAAGLAFRYDVSEWFAVAPNGLWRTALYDSAGRRQNSVPDKVAKDTSDPLSDGIVVPLVSCIRCHRESGLRPFADDQTKLLAGNVDLYSHDPNIVQRAAEFYDEPRLQRQMRFDRETYAAACALATTLPLPNPLRKGEGTKQMRPEELADALAAVVRQLSYLPVTPEQAAAEIGLTVDQFKLALTATHDPVIFVLLEGRSVLRGQWESSFAEAALAAAIHLGGTERNK